MDIGLKDLPQSKWNSGTGRQVILKGDFAKTQAAIIQSFGFQSTPLITWIDNTAIKVSATPDDIAAIMLNGFPSVLHPERRISAGLTDGRYRENTADVTLDFDLATNLWGTEKVSQWYVVYALAGNADTAFTLKAMPWMRVKSQASQIISLGTLVTPATGIGYGLNTDQLAGGALYFVSGASKGLLRTISGNNNDNTTGGTITYGGAALTVAQGDWFIVLPPATNFRIIGEIFNNSSGNIDQTIDTGVVIQWVTESFTHYNAGGLIAEDIKLFSPLAREARCASPGVQVAHPSINYDGTLKLMANIVPSSQGDFTIDIGCKFGIFCGAGGSELYRVAYRKPLY